MSSEKADVSKTFDVLDPRIQCLTPLSDNDEDHCLVTGAVPAGVVALLHSHADLGGEVPGLWQDRWSMLGVSDVFDVPGGLKYAWRNASGVSAALLLVCLCGWAGSFAILLRRVRRSQLMSSALSRHAYGYWLGSPTDNAAAGISVR
jgi:hypothetical protein